MFIDRNYQNLLKLQRSEMFLQFTEPSGYFAPSELRFLFRLPSLKTFGSYGARNITVPL